MGESVCMDQLTLLLALFVATIFLAPVATRLKLPYPVVLLVAGLAAAYIPGLPSPSISPELILPLVLPPLLFAAARRTSWREFLDNRRAIGLLAIALVLVTAFSVGVLVHALVPGAPLIAALALGAAVAPPDPVAATAAVRELGLRRRLRTTLEGEGLSNDATALVLYEVAVAGVVAGTLSAWGAVAVSQCRSSSGSASGSSSPSVRAGCSGNSPLTRWAARSSCSCRSWRTGSRTWRTAAGCSPW